jgi:hypothetical protein
MNLIRYAVKLMYRRPFNHDAPERSTAPVCAQKNAKTLENAAQPLAKRTNMVYVSLLTNR